MNKIVGIYKITNLLNDKIYIGQSINILKRWIKYRNLHCKSQKKLYNSFVKYGVENHKFEIIEECLIDLLNERERFWQDIHKALGENGLNLMLTQANGKSGTISEETRKKLKAKKLTELHKRKISDANKGRKLSEETKRKISDSQKKEKGYWYGKKLSDLHKEKLSKSAKGKNTWMLGKKLSNETRKKISENSATSKKVINKENGETYNSLAEMCRIFVLNENTLRSKLSGHRKNNTIFEYI
jgi:hypothetical protein